MKHIGCKQQINLKQLHEINWDPQEAKMKTKITWFDRVMAAATFAEANEHETAKEFLAGAVNVAENKNRCKDCDANYAADTNGVKTNS